MDDRAIRAALERHWAAADANHFTGEHAIYRDDAELRSQANWLRPDHITASGHRHRRKDRAPVVEDLSERELEVLRHLSELLTTEEIAAEMFISANTVRTHIRRILGKLSVSRRHEAVRRARELHLV